MSKPEAGRGLFVVVTGIDGCGKSTQVARIAKRLADEGVDVVSGSWKLDNVEGVFIHDLVRRLAEKDIELPPTTTTLLYAANVSYRLERRIRPALAAGKVVVEDDFAFKMIAHAHAYGFPREWVDALYSFIPSPDVGVVLDVPPDAAVQRIGHRVTNFESGLALDDRRAGFLAHQTRVREELHRLAARHGLEVLSVGDLPEAEVSDLLHRKVLVAAGTRGSPPVGSRV